MLTSTPTRQRRPALSAVIERRLLVNYRVDPDVVAPLLPAPFEPHLVHGWAVAGLCLLRLGHTRPAGLPAAVGVRSENAAHRIAVRWRDADGAHRTGVYVPQRHSASTLNVVAGDRVFPGVHGRATFAVAESPTELRLRIGATDGTMHVDVAGTVVERFAGTTLFPTLDDASAFFRSSPVGFSPSRRRPVLDGVELAARGWDMAPVDLAALASSFYDDRQRFPAGRIAYDSAFVMRQVSVDWHRAGTLPLGPA